MTQEEIIKLAHAAGFNWPDIQATTIEQRLERFAFLVAATEREKFTNTQEFVTLPREVVKLALESMDESYADTRQGRALADVLRAALEQPQESPYGECDECGTEYSFDPTDGGSICVACLKERLEQPQNHVPDVGNMVQAGWMPVPVEPTEAMLDAGCEAVDGPDWTGPNAVYRAMLDAAPLAPVVEQEPVAWIWTEWSSRKLTFDGPPAVPSVRDELTKPVWTPLYTRPQREREPLENEQSRRIYDSATYAASLAVFMTRVDAEHPDADDKGVSGWLQEAEYRVKRRITEAAHNIK